MEFNAPFIILCFLGITICVLLGALIYFSQKNNEKLFDDINNNGIPDKLEKEYKEGMDRATLLIKELVGKLHQSTPVEAPAPPPAPVVEAPVYQSPTAWLLKNQPQAVALMPIWIKAAPTPMSDADYQKRWALVLAKLSQPTN